MDSTDKIEELLTLAQEIEAAQAAEDVLGIWPAFEDVAYILAAMRAELEKALERAKEAL